MGLFGGKKKKDEDEEDEEEFEEDLDEEDYVISEEKEKKGRELEQKYGIQASARLELFNPENLEDRAAFTIKNVAHTTVIVPSHTNIEIKIHHWDGTDLEEEIAVEEELIIPPKDEYRFEIDGVSFWTGDRIILYYETEDRGRETSLYRM